MAAAGAMKRWQTVEVDAALVQQVRDTAGLPGALCALLASRGYTSPADIDRFLRPRLSDLGDPFRLPGMADAVGRIRRALSTGERMVVFGDYDVDGITSTALLVRVLRQLGGDVAPFIPHRIDDGYGLSPDALEKCLAAHRPGLIVTVDCGTSSGAAVERAGKAGVDVVVTDHHEATDGRAVAAALVNPKLDRDGSPQELAGVGVTFKLCHALLKTAREAGDEGARRIDLRAYLDLVAVGTVADIVPLVGESRIFARRGLDTLSREPCVGLQELMKVARVEGDVDAYHIGFILGPRLNAAGRLAEAEQALELLMTDDVSRAAEIAVHLDQVNRERREVEEQTAAAAFKEVERTFDPARDPAIVVAGQGWHPGVVGIVASRVCEKYYRPTAVIALDEEGGGRGSCRSIEGFNVADALESCAAHLVKSGGHAMAAGLEIEAGRVDAFRARLREVAAAGLRGKTLVPAQRVDGWLGLSEANEELLEALQALRPFGYRNQTPVWATRGVSVVGKPRVVGKGHLKMRVKSGGTEAECIGFGLGDRQVSEGPLDIAYQLKMNHFQGRDTLQLQVKDFRPTPRA